MASNRTAQSDSIGQRILDKEKADKKRPPYSWTQPCCAECWIGLKLKTGRVKLDDANTYFCCFCRQEINTSKSNMLYMLRLNPGTVPYPTLRKDGDH